MGDRERKLAEWRLEYMSWSRSKKLWFKTKNKIQQMYDVVISSI